MIIIMHRIVVRNRVFLSRQKKKKTIMKTKTTATAKKIKNDFIDSIIINHLNKVQQKKKSAKNSRFLMNKNAFEVHVDEI